jgi:transposase-like protein
MTTRDIQGLVQELNGVEVSPSLISEITAGLGSAIKLVYMAIQEASKKWKMPIRHWRRH